MIVLDTNVLSELMQSNPHPSVLRWAAHQSDETLYTTSISKAEIYYGISLLPEGHRRSGLADAAEAMFAEDFADRVLPFDEAAAVYYVEIVVGRRQAGNPISAFDALIAATALAAGMDVATRDVGSFAGCGLTLIDPWALK